MKIKLYFIILIAIFSNVGLARTPAFNKTRAFEYLKKQCAFGPRVPGSLGHQNCLKFFEQELAKFAAKVSLQEFHYRLPGTTKNMRGVNVVANFNPAAKRKLLLCAHWDTRPQADMDEDKTKRTEPVMGANDGASGVAVLLEIANQLKLKAPPYQVDIVLFDAEDAGVYQQNESWALGSKEYAQALNSQNLPDFGILLDLIGDRNLEIYTEINSEMFAPRLVKYVWKIAAQLGISEFIPQSQYQVQDDHLRLIEVGVPCIDIIDFDYPYWHTTHDTPDKCSPESLAKVGRVVLEVIYRGEY
ncbi:M28 family peptidase [candidate division KSB1 bacterium]|nr:M28 family peptidase [candidate division KSB1 bacterium]